MCFKVPRAKLNGASIFSFHCQKEIRQLIPRCSHSPLAVPNVVKLGPKKLVGCKVASMNATAKESKYLKKQNFQCQGHGHCVRFHLQGAEPSNSLLQPLHPAPADRCMSDQLRDSSACQLQHFHHCKVCITKTSQEEPLGPLSVRASPEVFQHANNE